MYPQANTSFPMPPGAGGERENIWFNWLYHQICYLNIDMCGIHRNVRISVQEVYFDTSLQNFFIFSLYCKVDPLFCLFCLLITHQSTVVYSIFGHLFSFFPKK